jgi:hypothetical protein
LDSRLQNTPFFQFVLDNNGRDRFRFYQNAVRTGNLRTRTIPHNLINENQTLIQSTDLIYNDGHIAICAVAENAYVTTEQITGRYFDIIHNYGYVNPANGENGIFLGNFAWFGQGFFKKTLHGPFAHWGGRFDNNANPVIAGRVYLWY